MRRPRKPWLAAVRTATGGLRRHKMQAIVIAMVLLVATASATIGLALLAASNTPFLKAFAAQRGADLAVSVDTGRASPAELAASTHLKSVTAAAGPFADVTVTSQDDGQPYGQLLLAGRSAPGGPIDDVVLSSGHWPNGPGQIVLDTNEGPGQGQRSLNLGSTLTVDPGPHAVTLTVVGFGNSVTDTADGWVAPSEIARLRGPGALASAEMLYSFTSAGGAAQLHTDLATVTRALPAGAVTGAGSWLTAEDQASGNAAIMEPFVTAFALIGLIMAVLIVGNVVSGAVVSSYYRIGVLKSIGLTPAQVMVAYLSRVGWPALAGCVTGVVAGNILADPILRQASAAYGVGSQQVPLWASVLAPAGMLGLTVLAAFGPSLRAGRLSATQAIAAGRAPAAGRGYLAHRLAARLRLPRPVGIGLAAPFARPARTMVALAAVAFGACAVIFAVGLHASLDRAEQSQTLSATAPVQVELTGPGSGPNQAPSAAQNAAVTSALAAQPGTARDLAWYGNGVKVTGMTGTAFANVLDGDSSWLGFGIISGHWYDGPGQVDVNTSFLTDMGLSVGDTATVDTGTSQTGVRIVGEVFQPSGQAQLFGSPATLPGLTTTANIQGWYVGLKPGTSASGYSDALNNALGSKSPWGASLAGQGGNFYPLASGLVATLALMVAVAAGLGVLNTVLMTTRDRVHDLGVYKTLGMRPGQLLTMVMCWVAVPAVVAAAIAAPAAVMLNSATVRAMAGTAHTGIPASFTQVFPPGRLALLSLAALVIAVAGALLPASWAARARPAVALRAE